MVLSQQSIDALNSYGQLLLDKDIAIKIVGFITILQNKQKLRNRRKRCLDVRLLYILHIIQLLYGYVIFTENLREISRFLEKLQGFICWKSAIAVSWGGKKLPPYKWKGMEVDRKVLLIMSNGLFFNWKY